MMTLDEQLEKMSANIIEATHHHAREMRMAAWLAYSAGKTVEDAAVKFQQIRDRNQEPEFVDAERAQQKVCKHEHKFACGLCAKCGAWTKGELSLPSIDCGTF